MAIPDFQTLMVPLLRHLGDGETRSNQQTLEALSEEFGLTPEERSHLLPSGRQALFTNRVAWAKTHLKRAGLLESPGRGVYRIGSAHDVLPPEVLRSPNRDERFYGRTCLG